MLERLRRIFSPKKHEIEFNRQLEQLRKQAPVPILWLFGKTQTGKTSIIKFLTGADDAEIGEGFRPCTRFSREYGFPAAEAPLLTFLDTRGVAEPSYDPAEDLARFDAQAHLVIVTVKLLDHAQQNVIEHLRAIRRAKSRRPILLVLTCLHEAYPQRQHPPEQDWHDGVFNPDSEDIWRDLKRSLSEQKRRFEGLVDAVVAIDLTPAEEGFAVPDYGGAQLKDKIIELLPAAYRQTLLTLERSISDLEELFAVRSLPHILGYSTLAATAGAFPIPWVDLLILPAIQTHMIYHLAQLYGQPLSAGRFLEIAGTLGIGIAFRQALRELVKVIPYVGSVAGGALAGASTFALGKAFCYYYRAVHQGHVPSAQELKSYYRDQLSQAQKYWSISAKGAPP
jgi:uncharacterized protein (DUF697 family)/predicted GTPase